MSGTQPSKPSNIIAREFRGARLYLKSVHAGRGMRWLADKTKAAKFLMPEALTICERASREWGTQCAVLDSAGNLAQRINAPSVEQTFKLYWSPEGKCIATVKAHTHRQAIRKAPKPYSKYLGEIYAEVQS